MCCICDEKEEEMTRERKKQKTEQVFDKIKV